MGVSQSPLTVYRGWFAGRRLTDAGCCRVSGLELVAVATKAYVHLCLVAQPTTQAQLTWASSSYTMVLGMCITNLAAA